MILYLAGILLAFACSVPDVPDGPDGPGGGTVDPPVDPPVVPTNPVKLKMGEIQIEASTASLKFTWDAVSGAFGYEVSFDGGAPAMISSTEWVSQPLKEETEHTLSVRAVSGSSAYEDSDPVTVTAKTLKTEAQTAMDLKWFELPMIYDEDKNGICDTDASVYYASHHCDGGEKAPSGVTARNFTVCFSAEHHCPLWVAAPRHSMYVGGSGRNDTYKVDPNIPSNIQYHSKETGGGCNKGHMLGSAERTSSVATNRQVFYYSNIAPQYSGSFNTGGGAWNNLEDYIDKLVPADTLYEVVGCYFDRYVDAYGTVAEPHRISFGGRNDVSCPTMFYYALLRTKKGNTKKAVTACSASELQCVAFVISHEMEKGHKPSKKDMMSVADLEKITGFTYFVNVPDAPKTSFNSSDWGL